MSDGSTVAIVARDLIIATRIADAAAAADLPAVRLDAPADLPPVHSVGVVLVDWSAREAHWGEQLASWCASAPEASRPRVVLFGPHTDLEAHAAARVAGLGPMLARSKLVADLPALVRERRAT